MPFNLILVFKAHYKELANAGRVMVWSADADGRLLKTHYGAFPDPDAVREWARP